MKIPAASEDNKECLDGIEVVGEIKPCFGKMPYYHSFGITENYFVLIENPLFSLNILSLAITRIMNWSHADLLKEDKSLPNVISVIDRKTGKVIQQYFADHFFVFHHTNAYENGDEIIVDLSGYDDASVIEDTYLSQFKLNGFLTMSKNPSDIRRYRLPLTKNKESNGPIPLPKLQDGRDFELIYSGFEFPKINYVKFNGKPYKYAYGVGSSNEMLWFDGLVKVNVDTKEVYEWKECGTAPSEPVFLEAPDAVDEDDGVVLSLVTNFKDNYSFLLILDGKSFKEVARAEIPHVVKPAFHGDFFK